jgi:ZIP family zinc transporter
VRRSPGDARRRVRPLNLGDAETRLAARRSGQRGALTIFFGVAMDLFSDGLMIGTGAVADLRLSLVLAIGQMPADVPEGFAAVATLRASGTPRGHRLALTAALALPILGATIGYWALRDAPELVTLSLLAFTGGVLTSVVVEDIIPEAHEVPDVRVATLLLVGGFSLFALIAAYLG